MAKRDPVYEIIQITEQDKKSGKVRRLVVVRRPSGTRWYRASERRCQRVAKVLEQLGGQFSPVESVSTTSRVTGWSWTNR